YQGRTFALLPGGWMAMRVKQVPLSSILREYEFIDLVDADIQGEELNAFPESIEELSKRAARVHIGTHSEESEVQLRKTFSAAAWPVADVAFSRAALPDGMRAAAKAGAAIAVFPELGITGYSCGDLFAQTLLLARARAALLELAAETAPLKLHAVVGLPLIVHG